MVERKLEITKKLEDLAKEGTLDSGIAILNLPSANYCEKRAEKIYVDGRLQQSCFGCVTQGTKSGDNLGIDELKKIIDFFAGQHSTRFITINGRGDPFNPKLRENTLEKISYAHEKYEIQAYVFTAGNNLDERTCQILADNEANVMISLFGNGFIDADFFAGKAYPTAPKPLQNQAEIARNLRRLIETYREHHNQSEEGTTRIGMNYVVSERDLADGGAKVRALKQAANENGIFFVVNTNFQKHPNEEIQTLFEQFANDYTDFHLRHSTAVNGQCQMGAGSSATVDYDGMLLRCPYMDNQEGDGRFQDLPAERIQKVLGKYMQDRSYPCVMRKHQK
ncbi:MAG TPA: hypothetical protein VJG49_02715 [Candidatus Nanoarchaeia archaeon]|nr:hypothetical protein [Candidatus Nanoarchaeia archaeon]